MISMDLVFNVTQNRSWKSDRRFRVWVADGAFRGALLHQDGPVENTGRFLGGIAPVFDVAGLLILIVLVPLALIWSAIIGRKERRKKQQLDALSPESDEYLGWDEPNFRLRASDIESAEFFEKRVGLIGSATAPKLELRLSNRQVWNFSIADRLAADQLQRELNQCGIVATRREKAV